MASLQTSLDSILVQLGDFGRYQILVFGLYSVAIILHSAANVAYVFTARDLTYRCYIPKCDSQTNPLFNEDWLESAVPFENNFPKKCQKYKNLNRTNTCSNFDFDKNIVEACDNFIYSSEDITIVKDFPDLHCEENVWKLAMVGTINNIGQFVGMPLSGWISDKYGRRAALVVGMVGFGISGIIRSFTKTYIWFLVFEFLDAVFCLGPYICGFILAVELVGPKRRVLMGTLASSCFALGEIWIGSVAWLTQSWRTTLLIIYIPAVCLLSYHWIVPESVRWLLTQGRKDEALKILKIASKVNKKQIAEESLQQLAASKEDDENIKYSIVEIFKSSRFILRCFNACFCWVTCTFLFYGITFKSVTLSGNPYLDFIFSALAEIPAYLATYVIVDRLGRRFSLFGSFLLTGVSCIGIIFIPDDDYILHLCIYLLGKFGATLSFTIIYIVTSEIFPTYLRNSMMGICAMFGRIGSMVAPQLPLLAQAWTPLPLVMFSAMGIAAGIVSLFFPETLNEKLPDTMTEAMEVGKNSSKEDQS